MKNIYALFFGLVWVALQVLIFKTLGFCSDWAKNIHSNFWFAYQDFLGKAIQKIPFSLGDVIYLVVGIFLVYKTLIFVAKALKKKVKKTKNHIFSWMLATNLMVFFYFMVWGFNYYKNSPFDSFSRVKTNPEELKNLAEELLLSASKLRNSCEEDHFGVYKLVESPKNYYKDLEMGQKKQDWKNQYKLPHPKNQKSSLFSYFLGYFGVGGYYNPFTTESQHNQLLPDSKKLFVFSHEFAHQMGFAKEGEANFVAYKLLNSSENRSWQYQAQLRALFYVLNNISKQDSLFAKKITNQFSLAMKRDWENEKKFNKQYQSILSDYFSKMNDVFLQLNNQKEGRESYGLFVNCLVAERRISIEKREKKQKKE